MRDSREHIIIKATALFLQKSFKAVTMKEIVESTGLSKGAFYHYFPSKESLYLEIVETYIKMLHIDFDKLSQNSLYDFFHDYIDSNYKKFLQLKDFLEDSTDENDINYIALIFDAISLFPGFKDKIRELHDRELSAWESAIQLAIERGEIKSSMTPLQIAGLFVYVNDGMSQRLIMQGQVENLQDKLLVHWEALYNELKI